MNHVDQWIAQQKKREKHFHTLQEGLFGGRLWQYVFFRLRYFFLNNLITIALHTIEFYLLAIIFNHSHFQSLILMRILGFAIIGGWWGALEVMRSRLRYFKHFRQNARAQKEIAAWLVLGFFLMMVVLAFAAYFGVQAFAHFTQGALGLFDIYILVILVQIAVQIFLQTLHSGIFATRRVFRTFTSIALPNLVTALLIPVLWPLLARYALPASFFLGVILNVVITYYYINKMYSLTGQQSGRLLPAFKQLPVLLREISAKECVLAIVASIAMRAETILLILLLPGVANNAQELQFFLLFYLISPQIRANFDWARLFYFDFKRLGSGLVKPLLNYLSIYAIVMAIVVTLGLWLISIPIAMFFVSVKMSTMLLLLVLFLGRAVIAYLQMRRFTKHFYWDVIISSLGIFIPAVILRAYNLSVELKLLVIVVALLGSAWYLLKTRLGRVQSVPSTEDVSFLTWLTQLAKIESSMHFFCLTLEKTIKKHETLALLLLIQERVFAYGGQVCRISDRQLLFYVSDNGLKMVNKKWLVVKCLGQATSCEQFQAKNGAELIAKIMKNEKLFKAGIKPSIDMDINKICELFQQSVPQGHILKIDDKKIKPPIMLDDKFSYGQLLSRIQQYIEVPNGVQSARKIKAYPAFQQEKLAYLFVIQPGQMTDSAAFNVWRNSLLQYNIHKMSSQHDRARVMTV